jgi:type II secretory pathway component GspD/PulD (secretin)
MRRIAALAVCALAPFAVTQSDAPARAEQPRPESAAPVHIRIGSDGFVLPAGDIELRELIEAAAYYLQRNIVSNPDELRRAGGEPLHLQKELAVDALGCEDVLSQMLYMRGFAVIEVDSDKRLYEVIHLQGTRAAEVAASAPHRAPEEILRRPHLKQYVVTEVQLQHVDAQKACSMLRPFFANAIGGMASNSLRLVVGTMGNRSSLLLGGFQDDLAQAILLVRACDTAHANTAEPEEDDLAQRVRQLEAGVTRPTGAAAAEPKAH